MQTLILSLLVASFMIGSALAAPSGNSPGFDRVGHLGEKTVAVPTSRQIAPGEDRHADNAATPERRREMARRLLWLMLSAR